MRRITAAAIILSMVFVLFACGNTQDAATTAQDTVVTGEDSATGTVTEPAESTGSGDVVPAEPTAYEIYKNAAAKTAALTDFELETNATEYGFHSADDYASLNTETTLRLTEKTSGRGTAERRTELYTDYAVSVSGQKTRAEIREYIEGDKVYVLTAPYTGYLPADDQTAKKALGETNAPFGVSAPLDEKAFEGATVYKYDDGRTALTVTPQPDALSDYVGKLFESIMLNASFEDVRSELVKIKFDFTVSADGFLTRIAADFTVDSEVTVSDVVTKTRSTVNSVTEYRNPGAAVTVETPSKLFAASYSVYDAENAAAGNTEKMILYKDGTFESHTDGDSDVGGLVKMHTKGIIHGSYVKEGETAVCTAEGADLFLTFASEEQKTAFKAIIDSAKQSGAFGDKEYDMFIAAISEEGFTGSMAELAEMDQITDFKSDDVKENFILDDNAGIAYRLIDGFEPKDGEYYIPASELMLTLEDGGKCTLERETVSDDEDGFGEYTQYEKYAGTYKRDGQNVVCTVTEVNVRLVYKNESSVRTIRQQYTALLNSGGISENDYAYFMSLISDEGYLEKMEIPETINVSVEDHTHTGVIADADVQDT